MTGDTDRDRKRRKPNDLVYSFDTKSLAENDEVLEAFGGSDVSDSPSKSGEKDSNEPQETNEHSTDSESDTDSNMWESVSILNAAANSTIPGDISVTFEDRNKVLKKKHRAAALKARDTKAAKKLQLLLHVCHTQCLILHGKTVNAWLNKKILQRHIKKEVPEELRREVKKYHRRVANGTLKGKTHALTFDQLILLVVKWWRNRFKLTEKHGLRSGDSEGSKSSLVPLSKQAATNMYIDKGLKLSGSLELGAQLFVAILRSLGFDTRLVYSPPAISYEPKSHRKTGADPGPQLYLFPLLWAEVYDAMRSRYVSVDPFVLTEPIHSEKYPVAFEPHGPEAGSMKMYYAIGMDSRNAVRDLTPKYMDRERLTRPLSGFRDSTAAKAYGSYLYFLERFCSTMRDNTDVLRNEAKLLKKRMTVAGIPRRFPDSIAGYKKYPALVVESLLPKTHAPEPGANIVHQFRDPKTRKTEHVYLCSSVVVCRSQQSWIRDARVVSPGEKPLRRVEARALTINGQRRLEQNPEYKGTALVDLFCYKQTSAYVSRPVADGVLPKNEYGSIYMFRPEMVPHGAKHFLHPGIEKTAVRLNIPYAPALVDFRFKHRNAYPIHKGIVVALENEELLMTNWRADFRKKILDQSVMKRKKALYRWNLYCRRLYLLQRLKKNYG